MQLLPWIPRPSRLESVAFWAVCIYIAAILLVFAIWALIKTALNISGP